MRLLIVILFSILFTLFFNVLSEGYTFKYDKYKSHTTISRDLLSTYNLAFDSLDKYLHPTLKSVGAFGISYWFLILGHEYGGHGEVLRRLGIPCSYKFSNGDNSTIREGKVKGAYANLYLKIGGFRAEKHMRDLLREDQIRNGVNYKNSIFLTRALLNLCYDFSDVDTSENSNNDFYKYSRWITVVNHPYPLKEKTKIDVNFLKKRAKISAFDPLLLFSVFNTGAAFVGREFIWNINYIPTIDFNMYTTAVTTEVGIGFCLDEKFIKVNLEHGQNVFNKKVYGFSTRVTKICKIKDINIDFGFHYVKDYVCSADTSLIWKNYLVDFKVNFDKVHDLEKDIEVAVGITF